MMPTYAANIIPYNQHVDAEVGEADNYSVLNNMIRQVV